MTLIGTSLIAGQPGHANGKPFWTVNPATGQRLTPDFHPASGDEVSRALAAAATAFADYRTRTPEERARLLEAMAKEIEALGDALLQRAHAETGLPLPRLTGERARTCGQLRLFASLVREGSWVDARIDPALPNRQPLPRPDLRRMLQPIGPVVVFGSSNFPLAFSVAGGDTASALAAGCPVCVKAHRAHAGTAELVGGAIVRAVAGCGLPAGVFSLIHGDGASVGIAMVKHPATAAVGFTGSHTAGRALFDAAAARPHPIPVFAEMSSLNPVFLLPNAVHDRPDDIAKGLLTSFTLGVGQFCTKPGLVFTLRSPDTDVFVQKFAAGVRAAPCGTMLTSSIRDAFYQNRGKIASVVGVQPIVASSVEADPAHTEAQPGFAIARGIRFLENPELATEAFGPFLLIVIAETEDELKACAQALEGQLTATVHGTDADLAEAQALISILEQKAGRLLINSYPTGVEVAPAMNHGGPYPATSDVRFTSVGTAAIFRFVRPVCYQSFPNAMLPAALQDANPLGLLRLVDGKYTREPAPRSA